MKSSKINILYRNLWQAKIKHQTCIRASIWMEIWLVRLKASARMYHKVRDQNVCPIHQNHLVATFITFYRVSTKQAE